MQAMQQMQAQQANASQVQQNAALSTQTATGGGGQAPKTGEGGEQ